MSREEWQNSQDFSAALEDRLKNQVERESAFMNTSIDAFAIYQLKDDDALRDIRFEPMSWLESKGICVNRSNYDLVYTASLANKGGTADHLEELWKRFNMDHPVDYHRPSLSVSDIIALKQNGIVSCHYVDSFGFRELPTFLNPNNYLKNAEMAMEDDYGMIDGIINNGRNPGTKKPQQIEKRVSVLEQLASQPPKQEHKKTAPFHGADKER